MPVVDQALKDKLLHAIEEKNVDETLILTKDFQPFDLADFLSILNWEEQLFLVSAIPSETAAEALVHLDSIQHYQLLDHIEEPKAREILNDMSSDEIVDLITAIHPRQAERLLKWLPDEYQRKIRDLMTYPENTAGGLAAVDYVAARETWTADQALAHIRKVGTEAEIISYIYTLSPSGNLVGVTSLRELILAPPQARLSSFVNRSVISVSALADQEEVAQLFTEYDLVALPVTDQNGRMVGIITVDDVLDVIEEEATEDFHLGAAISPLKENYQDSSIWSLYRKRVGWLVILVLVNLASSGVIAAYEETLATALALAFFIPLLIDSGGNAGAQSATLMVRALATEDIELNHWLRIVGKELGVGLSLGATLGAASWVLGLLRGGPQIGVIVALAMVSIVVVANVIGILLPFILTRLRQDPAVASSPLITTVVDASGLLIYFSIARWILGTL